MSTWHDRITQRKQEKEDSERKKLVEVNDVSFPTLGGSSVWGSASASGSGEEKKTDSTKKMSELVAEWDAQHTEMAELEAYRVEAEKSARERALRQEYRPIHYRLGNTHSRKEDTYYEEYEVAVPTADTSDDWRMVERPIRRPKKSAIERELTEKEPEFAEDEEAAWRTEETVWGREAEHH